MSRIWMKTSPEQIGQPAATPLEEDPTAVLMWDGVPDVVRVPEELGGDVRRVHDMRAERCPLEGCVRVVPHLVLIGEPVLMVACCPEHAFNWYRYQD